MDSNPWVVGSGIADDNYITFKALVKKEIEKNNFYSDLLARNGAIGIIYLI